jgi:HTH-type transcriptional regulator / antitoxin HipB
MVAVRTVSDIGALIRDARKQAGLDQGQLAELANVSRLWINEIEKGKPNAGVGRILRTLAVLNIELDARDRYRTDIPADAHSTANLISQILDR